MVDKECLDQLTDNIKHPGIQINVVGAMVATPYYKTTGISISKTMIQWDPNIN